MTAPSSEWPVAIRDAARAAAAAMEASGNPLREDEDLDGFARHFETGSFQFAFCRMSGGADADAAKEVDEAIREVEAHPPSGREDGIAAAARLMWRVMDLHGYAIRDDYDEFEALFGREIDGWVVPSFRSPMFDNGRVGS